MKKLFWFVLLIGFIFKPWQAIQGQNYMTLSEATMMAIEDQTSLTSFNMTIGENAMLKNRGELTVYGILTNSAGQSGLVIEADENGYGSLLHYTPGVPATVKQYLESEHWHLVTPPVANSTIAPYLDLYLKEWSEPSSSWNYLTVPLTLMMDKGKGYSAWASNELTGSTTIVFEGSLEGSNTAISGLSWTPENAQAGWNLVGNPYPCPVEWSENWILNNVGGWSLVYDNGIYKGWNPYLPDEEKSYNGKTDGFIAPTQGFWIRAYGENPYIMIPQSARAHRPDEFLKIQSGSTLKSLHLIASGNGYEDETMILFHPEGSTGFDGLYELEKYFNVEEAPTVYSMMGNQQPFAVLVMPENWIEETSHPVIPVGFDIGKAVSCTITASGLESFGPNPEIFLEDLKENSMHDLSTGNYPFVSSPGQDPDRFLLHFKSIDSIPGQQGKKEISVYAYGSDVYVQLPASANGIATIYDMLGQKICNYNVSPGLTKQSMTRTGYYVVHVYVNGTLTNKKVFISN